MVVVVVRVVMVVLVRVAIAVAVVEIMLVKKVLLVGAMRGMQKVKKPTPSTK